MAHKAVHKVYDFYIGLPAWGKFVVVIGGASIAWFGIANPIRKVIIKKLDESKAIKEAKQAGQQLDTLRKQGIKPTITSAQAQSFANSLVQAFTGCGTDE